MHLYVIEGTASIAERQKLREKRIAGSYNIEECVYTHIYINREREKKGHPNSTYYFISDKAAGIEDDDDDDAEEAGRVHTKFPTLRFALHNLGFTPKYPTALSPPFSHSPLPPPPLSLFPCVCIFPSSVCLSPLSLFLSVSCEEG